MRPYRFFVVVAAVIILAAAAPSHTSPRSVPDLASASPQTIKPGEIWPDDRGQHIQAHGGGIIKLADTYYWFGEDRSQGLDRAKRYVACYSSSDLAHWTFRNQVMKQAEIGDGKLWLPEPKNWTLDIATGETAIAK